jgi:hypothetical protein
LLRALNPSLDGVVLTAALGGLEALNDQRAVHVLVDWLKRAPDYLKLDTVKVLRALTGQTMGPEVPAWTTWIATAKIPKPPTFEPRDHNPHIELGLPTP